MLQDAAEVLRQILFAAIDNVMDRPSNRRSRTGRTSTPEDSAVALSARNSSAFGTAAMAKEDRLPCYSKALG